MPAQVAPSTMASAGSFVNPMMRPPMGGMPGMMNPLTA